jgi:hypothetical protein
MKVVSRLGIEPRTRSLRVALVAQKQLDFLRISAAVCAERGRTRQRNAIQTHLTWCQTVQASFQQLPVAVRADAAAAPL